MAYPNKTSGARTSGQINLIQTIQTAAYGTDLAIVDSKEIKGGLHYVQHIGDLTDQDWDGIFSTRKRTGMMVYVHYENDGTTLHDKYYKLKSGLPGTTITDWELLSFGGSTIVINNIDTVADIAARDALPSPANGDVAHVTDASADPAISSGGASYIYDGSTWTRILGADGINPADVIANTAARHTQNTDTELDNGGANNVSAATIVSHINDISKHAEINDSAGLTNTNELWSADKIQTELNLLITDITANDADIATLVSSLSGKVDVVAGKSLVLDTEISKIHERNKDTATTAATQPNLAEGDAVITDINGVRDIVTVGLKETTLISYEDSSTNREVKYILKAGTDADNGVTILRPADYASSTNEKVWALVGVGIVSIGDALDVDTTGLGIGQTLVWDGSNFVPTAGLINAIDDLNDVDTTTVAPSTGQFLKWDGSNWVPDSIPSINALNDVGDVNAPSPSDGQSLVWDNGSSRWVPATVASNPISVASSAALSTFTVSGDTTFDLTTSNTAHRLIPVTMDQAFDGDLTFTNGIIGVKYTIRLTTSTTAFTSTIALAANTKTKSATSLIAPNNGNWVHDYHVEYDGTTYWVTPEYDQN